MSKKINCPICNKEFEQVKVGAHFKKYCSYACKRAGHWQRKSGKTKPTQEKISLEYGLRIKL